MNPAERIPNDQICGYEIGPRPLVTRCGALLVVEPTSGLGNNWPAGVNERALASARGLLHNHLTHCHAVEPFGPLTRAGTGPVGKPREQQSALCASHCQQRKY